jgi:predicted NUDIX family NTP pyrophosphohydrolase
MVSTMATTNSAGILLFRRRDDQIEVLLGHMGGPFWEGKDQRAWSIPKGVGMPGEPPVDVAKREFREEIGIEVPGNILIDLGQIRQSRYKVVSIWASEGDLDASLARSNSFEMEWPPKSGRLQSFPEIDRAAWVDLDAARHKLVQGQVPILDRLLRALADEH